MVASGLAEPNQRVARRKAIGRLPGVVGQTGTKGSTGKFS